MTALRPSFYVTATYPATGLDSDDLRTMYQNLPGDEGRSVTYDGEQLLLGYVVAAAGDEAEAGFEADGVFTAILHPHGIEADGDITATRLSFPHTIRPGDSVSFDGHNRVDWTVQGSTPSGRYTVCTANLVGTPVHTIIDWHDNVRGTVNRAGQSTDWTDPDHVAAALEALNEERFAVSASNQVRLNVTNHQPGDEP